MYMKLKIFPMAYLGHFARLLYLEKVYAFNE
ncbi:hypothetical protein AAKU67_004215 [Oxalobacteraceae bacterium GrIS 2.11]